MPQTQNGTMDGDTPLDTPIKIQWTGYARDRLYDYNLDFQEDDSPCLSPTRYVKTMQRQKTNVIIKTVEEANAVYKELHSYRADDQTWMNGMMGKSMRRVNSAIRDAMEDQGYEADIEVTQKRYGTFERFRGFKDGGA